MMAILAALDRENAAGREVVAEHCLLSSCDRAG
jgi:hypothetical protein